MAENREAIKLFISSLKSLFRDFNSNESYPDCLKSFKYSDNFAILIYFIN
jgi:hypothetical protein